MKKTIKPLLWGILLFIVACKSERETYQPRLATLSQMKSFEIEATSVRAMTLLDEKNVGFAGSGGVFGFIDTKNATIFHSTLKNKGIDADFRSVGATLQDFLMLSAGNPARIFKTSENQMKEVYHEMHDAVFYDSMLFFDSENGMAVGDATEGCLSVLTTKDGGASWKKITCEKLPKMAQDEALFAASNSNIAQIFGKVWVITGGSQSRIFITDTQWKNWEAVTLPIIQGSSSQGAFSVDFYDTQKGIVMGGDYLQPENKKAIGALTFDGGKKWQTIDEQFAPGYVSCVKYIPDTKGNELLATGPNGIWFSNSGGKQWQKVDEGAYHAMLFLDRNTFVASANGKITLFRIKFTLQK